MACGRQEKLHCVVASLVLFHFLVLDHMIAFMSCVSISCNNTLSMIVESKSCHMTRRDLWHKPDNVRRTSSGDPVFLITLTGLGSLLHNRATVYSVGQPIHSKHNDCWCCFKANTCSRTAVICSDYHSHFYNRIKLFHSSHDFCRAAADFFHIKHTFFKNVWKPWQMCNVNF